VYTLWSRPFIKSFLHGTLLTFFGKTQQHCTAENLLDPGLRRFVKAALLDKRRWNLVRFKGIKGAVGEERDSEMTKMKVL